MDIVTCKLRSMVASVLILLLFYDSQIDANVCAKQKMNLIETNVSLPHHMFDKLYPGGLMLCARECKYRPRCKSFNYIESNGECQLNDDTMSGTVQNISGVVYSDINDIPEAILGNCENSYCSHLQRCEPSENSYICGYAYENVTNANHSAFLGHTFDVVTANTEDDCVQACMLRSACLSFNYKPDSNTCELNTEVMITDYQSYIGNQPNSYYSNIDLYDRAVLGACATHTCDQYSKCEDNGGSYICTLLYCPSPAAPYADIHVVPEFNLTIIKRRIGQNLSYSCWTSYYPNTDWTCLNNGTWNSPECKALTSCVQLFTNCNPEYGDGAFVFKIPGTESDMIVNCYTNSTRVHLRIQQNTSYGYYSTKHYPSCYTQANGCGKRIFNAIRLIMLASQKVIPTDALDFSSTDCDGPKMHSAGKNCDPACSLPSPGEIHMDLRGSGLKYKAPMSFIHGNLTFSEGDQVIDGTCSDCVNSCYIDPTIFLVASDREINYIGAVAPACNSR